MQSVKDRRKGVCLKKSRENQKESEGRRQVGMSERILGAVRNSEIEAFAKVNKLYASRQPSQLEEVGLGCHYAVRVA